MKSMSKPSENLGGLIKIWAVPPSDIVVSSFYVEILSTENIIELYCIPESMQFAEDSENIHGCTTYKTEITAKIPKDSDENGPLLYQLTGRKWIVIYQDQNELFKTSGTNQIPHRFSVNTDSGKAISDLNCHQISFHSKQLTRPIIVPNPFD